MIAVPVDVEESALPAEQIVESDVEAPVREALVARTRVESAAHIRPEARPVEREELETDLVEPSPAATPVAREMLSIEEIRAALLPPRRCCSKARCYDDQQRRHRTCDLPGDHAMPAARAQRPRHVPSLDPEALRFQTRAPS